MSAGADAQGVRRPAGPERVGRDRGPAVLHLRRVQRPALARTLEQARARVQELKKIGRRRHQDRRARPRHHVRRRWTRRRRSACRSRTTPASRRSTRGTTSTSGPGPSSTGTACPTPRSSTGVQHFPAGYNYADEVDRFRSPGRIWREADPERLDKVLHLMATQDVAWVPTLVIYEASRDLRAGAERTGGSRDDLDPTLEAYFRPDRRITARTSSPERRPTRPSGMRLRLWMAALRDFERRAASTARARTPGRSIRCMASASFASSSSSRSRLPARSR